MLRDAVQARSEPKPRSVFCRWVVRGSLLVLVLAVIRSTAAVPTAYEDATNSPKPDLIVYALI